MSWYHCSECGQSSCICVPLKTKTQVEIQVEDSKAHELLEKQNKLLQDLIKKLDK